MHFSYERFLENQIRKAFTFEGRPSELSLVGENRHFTISTFFSKKRQFRLLRFYD